MADGALPLRGVPARGRRTDGLGAYHLLQRGAEFELVPPLAGLRPGPRSRGALGSRGRHCVGVLVGVRVCMCVRCVCEHVCVWVVCSVCCMVLGVVVCAWVRVRA